MTHLLHSCVINSQDPLKENTFLPSALSSGLTARRSQKVNREKRKTSMSHGDRPLTQTWGPMPPRLYASVLKTGRERGPVCDHFIGTSRMFGRSAVLNKHHWSLNPSLLPCLHYCFRQNIWMCRGVHVHWAPSMYINRLYLLVSPTAGLVCQCLYMIMFDYVSECVNTYKKI